jgi:hypothetical protein
VSELNYHTKVNDAIKGRKIILEAGYIKMYDRRVRGSHRHTAQHAEGRQNAVAWVDIEVYPMGQFKLPESGT